MAVCPQGDWRFSLLLLLRYVCVILAQLPVLTASSIVMHTVNLAG